MLAHRRVGRHSLVARGVGGGGRAPLGPEGRVSSLGASPSFSPHVWCFSVFRFISCCKLRFLVFQILHVNVPKRRNML
jgi:hypothetical protein